MKIEEMIIKADGIYCQLRLTAEKTEKKGAESRRMTLGMIMNDVISLEKRAGKQEIFLGREAGWRKIGTFNEEYKEVSSDVIAYGEKYLELKSKNKRIRIIERVADSGYMETIAYMKTKNHWYEKWKETKLENISITPVVN